MSSRPDTAQSAISSELSIDDENSNPAAPARSPFSTEAASPNLTGTVLRGPTPLSVLVARNNARSGTNTTVSSRPDSPVSHRSKSHVPSLAAQGFLRPMSSQRLQAQRLGRPSTAKTRLSYSTDDGTRDHDNGSRGSMSTLRQEHQSEASPVHGPRPRSRGTETSDPIIERTSASPLGSASPRSLGDSVRLLQERTSQRENKTQHLTLPKSHEKLDPSAHPMNSSHSLRSTFSIASKRGSFRQKVEAGHEPLSSNQTSPRFDASQTSTNNPHSVTSPKNYEYFEGNTIFFWGGRLQNARDRPVNLATGVLLVLPGILFFSYSAPWLWHNVSPAVPIVFAYLFLVCLSSFVHASLVDPGVFPRNLHPFPPPDPEIDPLTIGPPMNDWIMIRLATSTSETAAMDVPVKYCKTCNIWRPPRCYHCRVCDNCIETLDHHCVWLNNCVGRRNYRYFFTFVTTTTLLSILLIGASLGHLLAYRAQQQVSFGTAISAWKIPFAMAIYGVMVLPYPASLSGYHLFLMSRGETTREYLSSQKFAKTDRHRPFTQGNFLKNWISVLARPRPPTYLHFKRKYEEGDQRFGFRRGRRQASLVEEAKGGGAMELLPVAKAQKALDGSSKSKKIKSEA